MHQIYKQIELNKLNLPNKPKETHQKQDLLKMKVCYKNKIKITFNKKDYKQAFETEKDILILN